MPDLLPADFGEEGFTPPVAILREQAMHLTRRLGGQVLAEVTTEKKKNGVLHNFCLNVPIMDNYTYIAFSVSHDVLMYPLTVHQAGGAKTIATPLEFNDHLRQLFSGELFKKAVVALKAQAHLEANPGMPDSIPI